MIEQKEIICPYCFNARFTMNIDASIDNSFLSTIEANVPYEPITSAIFASYCRIYNHSNFTFLDIGAHFGYYSTLCHFYAPSAIVYAFEPLKTTYDVLESNFKDVENVHCFNCAIHEKEGKMAFWWRPEVTSSGTFEIDTLHRMSDTYDITPPFRIDKGEVDTKKISDFDIDWSSVNLVKLDTQGTEILILDQLLPLLKKNSVLFIEYSDEVRKYVIDSKLNVLFHYIDKLNMVVQV